MNILVATAKMGTARPADVCELLNLDVSTLSRNVERMKQRGWLQLSRNWTDDPNLFSLLHKGASFWKTPFQPG